jgi:Histidine kinase-like ATPase domain
MIARHLSFDALCRPLEPLVARWMDAVVPQQVEPVPNNLYSSTYAWMYAYERGFRDRLEHALGRPLGAAERVLFGTDGVVSEGLSNAFVHGHGRAENLPIEVECRAAWCAIGVSIRDRGHGFDVDQVLDALSRGRSYYRFAGNGLRALDRNPRVLASWGGGGRALYLRVDLSCSSGGPRASDRTTA